MSFVVVAVTATVAAGAMNYQASREAADQAKLNARHNAALLAMQEKQVKEIADREAGKIRLQGQKVRGTQRAITAASGVVLGQGSALDIERETEFNILEDIETVKTNAALEAWGYRTNATATLIQGQQQAQALRTQGSASLIGSLGSAGATMYGANK